VPNAKPKQTAGNGEVVADAVSRDLDFRAWLGAQAGALRSRSFASVDWDGVAEELEDMAKREERDLSSQLKNLFVHLLKWGCHPEKKSRSWENSIDESREQIADLLADSPSLKNKSRMQEFIEKAYLRARRKAGKEMRLSKKEWERRLPAACPWTFEEFMTEDFLPSSLTASNS
jgi:hypothetical protein